MKKIVSGVLLVFSLEVAAADDPFDFDIAWESQSQPETGSGSGDGWDLRYTGVLEGRIRKNTAGHGFQSERLRLDSSVKFSIPWFSGFTRVFMDYDDEAHHWDEQTQAVLYEAYLSGDLGFASLPSVGWTLGKQRITWGMTDGLTTSDLLNATDFKDPIANGRTVRKFPSWAARVTAGTALGTTELVYLPWGKYRRSAEHGSTWELQQFAVLYESEHRGLLDLQTELNPHRPEFGLRHTWYGEGFDVGAIYHNGMSDLPALESVPGAALSRPVVRLRPVRQRTYSLNGAYTAGSSTLRGELAYTDRAPCYNSDGRMYFSRRVEYILGWDLNFDHDVYVNIQLFHDWYHDAQDDYGFTYAVSWQTLDQALTLGLSGFAGYRDEHTLDLYADYAVSDALKLHLRYFGIGGGVKGSMYRSYGKNDFIEAGFSWYF